MKTPKLPTNPDLVFVPIPDSSAIVVAANNVRKPLGLYAFDGGVYVKWSGGYIRVMHKNEGRSTADHDAYNTSLHKVWVQCLLSSNVELVKQANGQCYPQPKGNIEHTAREALGLELGTRKDSP